MVDEDGGVTVAVEANGNGEKARSRTGLFGRAKMNVTQTNDQSVTVEADSGARLVVSGDPSTGEILVVEVPEAAEEGDTAA